MTLRIIIIGGGAAGVFAAITAAEANPRADVQVLEHAQQPLGKVRISGGGRCNVTHACFDPATLTQFYPRGGRALRGAFTRFQPRDTVAWFERRGVRLKTEPDGRMFPVTDDSATIIDCLLHAARRANVQLQCGVRVREVQRTTSGFTLTQLNAPDLIADKILLATGSNAHGWAWAKQLGHTVHAPVPSLFSFNIADASLRALAGIAVPETQVMLKVGDQTFTQTGALLITHWGVSGPVILKLSAWGARALHEHAYRAELQVNWWPTLTEAQFAKLIQEHKLMHARRRISTDGLGPFPQRLWAWLATEIDAEKRWAEFSKADAQYLNERVLHCRLPITGKGAFKDEFVTCGGVELDEVNFKTMESRVCPGLYFAGEILDIDGLTGGFNFQNAWTTGWLAGQALAKKT